MRNSLMRIAQLLLPGASSYERKSQRLDAVDLNSQHDISLIHNAGEASGFGLVHVYGPRELPPALFAGFPTPYVASGTVRKPRFAFRSPRQPDYSLAPVESDDFTLLPEAVDERYFDMQRNPTELVIIGSIDRPGAHNMIEQTIVRI